MDTASLVYFRRTGSNLMGPHPELAADFQRLKAVRRLTQSKLARIAGVSRRHVALALAGGNITVTIMKKLMTALQAETIQLGPLMTAQGTVAGVNPEVIVAATQQIELGVTAIAAATASLRTYTHPSSKTADLDPQAAALVDQFISRVQNADPNELQALQRAVDDTSRSEDTGLARPPGRSHHRASRKRTTTTA